MKQRLIGALAAGSLLVGLVAVPSLAAQGGTERYQVGTTAYTIAVLDTYVHFFVVTENPCDGSIAITGSTAEDGGYYTTETVAGTLAGGVISFTSTYDGPYNPGYSWSGSFAVEGGELSGDYTGTVVAEPTTYSAFRNHGEYVSSMGGGADAAHSCIGMPLASGGSPGADNASFAAKVAAVEARLLATLQGVVAKLQANPHAATHAAPAVQKQVDRLTSGTPGPADAKVKPAKAKPAKEPKAATSAKSSKPSLPAAAQGHPNKDSHPSRP